MQNHSRTSLTRRRLLQHGAIGTGAATVLTLLPRPLTAMLGGHRADPIPPIQDDRVKALVQRTLDAAKSTDAEYADIRMTHTRERMYGHGAVYVGEERESLHVGVRALVSGYWGFAASPVWSPEEAVRLGREAVRQAKANSLGKVRDVMLPPASVVRDGHWETPVEIDPFVLHPDDIGDHLNMVTERLMIMMGQQDPFGRLHGIGGGVSYTAWAQAKAFGSTDGTYLTQRILRSVGGAGVSNQVYGGGTDDDLLTATGAGWELVRNAPIVETVRQNLLHNMEMARLPVKPIDVGRYATVFDAKSVAHLVSTTVGAATQIDRALGYRANDIGTSFLLDPEEMLGTYQVGGPSLTVTANRNEAGGTATTRWDDDGVEPGSFTLVDRGVVADFHTSREGAGWLKARYDQLGRPFRSNGCAYSKTANDPPSIQTANLVMQPDQGAVSHRDLEAGIEKGMSIVGVNPSMDFQLTSGFSNSLRCYEIRNGKRVAHIQGAGILFRTSELWKSILGIGGKESQRCFGLWPIVTVGVGNDHSVTAVPMAIKELTFIDRERR